MITSVAYAQAGSGGSSTPQSNPMMQFLPIILIFVVFYFLLIRPQQKKQRSHQEMLKNLKKGDKVITSGGIIGTVIGVSEKMVVLRVAENVKLEFARGAITGLQRDAESGESTSS